MKFGTSGLRGLVSEMPDAVCEAYAAAFVDHLRRTGLPPHEVLAGRDLRPSSPRIAAACLRALRARGVRAIDCGVVPTPALALEAARRGAAAVMVTGSHIPFDRNGIKFYRADGEINKADEAGITAALAAPGPAVSSGPAPAVAGIGPRSPNATSRATSTSSGRAASPAAGSGSTSTAPPAATCWARRCAGSGRR